MNYIICHIALNSGAKNATGNKKMLGSSNKEVVWGLIRSWERTRHRAMKDDEERAQKSDTWSKKKTKRAWWGKEESVSERKVVTMWVRCCRQFNNKKTDRARDVLVTLMSTFGRGWKGVKACFEWVQERMGQKELREPLRKSFKECCYKGESRVACLKDSLS